MAVAEIKMRKSPTTKGMEAAISKHEIAPRRRRSRTFGVLGGRAREGRAARDDSNSDQESTMGGKHALVESPF
jgi:hypothetical protein